MASRKFCTLKINHAIGFIQKLAEMHWLGCNDAVSQPTANFENFEINSVCQPAVRLGCARCRAPEISHDKGNGVGFTKMLF